MAVVRSCRPQAAFANQPCCAAQIPLSDIFKLNVGDMKSVDDYMKVGWCCRAAELVLCIICCANTTAPACCCCCPSQMCIATRQQHSWGAGGRQLETRPLLDSALDAGAEQEGAVELQGPAEEVRQAAH